MLSLVEHFDECRYYEPARNYIENIKRKVYWFFKQPKRVSNNNPDSSPKVQRLYWLPEDSTTRIYICKNMFMATLGYTSDKSITTALTNVNEFSVSAPDMHGKHPLTHRLTEAQKDDARNHISSFHPQISHYRREHAPNRLYLPPELSVVDMYKDYSESCQEPPISYVSYGRQVRDMNISFAKLGDEECETCESHKMHLKEEKAKDKEKEKKNDKTKGKKNRKTDEKNNENPKDKDQERSKEKVEKLKHIDTENICKMSFMCILVGSS